MNIGMLVSNEVVRDTRVLLEARGLARHGHRVRIVGWDRFDPSVTDGPIGDGVEIALVRTRGVMGAVKSSVFRNPLFWRRAYRLARRWPADVWWAHDLDTLPAGVWLQKATRRPLVYDSHEAFAEMIRDDYSRRVVRIAERLEDRLLRAVDHVVTVDAALGEHYRAFGIPVAVVMNCREDVADRWTPPTEQEFTVLYVGTFHRQRFVFEIIRAVQETKGVRLKIGGYKALSGEVRRACEASPRTTFLGPVPQADVLPLTRECHLVCAVLDPANVNNRMRTPNKVFEALAAGRPLLASNGTRSGDIVASVGCGMTIANRVDACKEALETLRDDPELQREFGEAALRAAKGEYSWATQERKLLAVLDRITA